MSLAVLPKPFIDEPITYKPQSTVHITHLLVIVPRKISRLKPAQAIVIQTAETATETNILTVCVMCAMWNSLITDSFTMLTVSTNNWQHFTTAIVQRSCTPYLVV